MPERVHCFQGQHRYFIVNSGYLCVKVNLSSEKGDLFRSDGSILSKDGNLSSEDGNLSSEDGNLSSEDGSLLSVDGDLLSVDGDLSVVDGELSRAAHVFREPTDSADEPFFYISTTCPSGASVTCFCNDTFRLC